jgi:tetratricopeptide (TPR) repeat protein
MLAQKATGSGGGRGAARPARAAPSSVRTTTPMAPPSTTPAPPAAAPTLDRRTALALALAAAAIAAPSLPPPPPARAAAAPAAAASSSTPQPPRPIIAQPIPPARITLSLAPDQSLYDPSDPRLREAARLIEEALGAQNVRQEEALWTRAIQSYSSSPSADPSTKPPWEDDVVGRCLGNRGNARARQGRLDEAVADYNAAMLRAPWSVDPVLNRGVALEAAGRLGEAAEDYRAVLAAAPDDPSAWNNLGNVLGKRGEWPAARDAFSRAADLAPRNAFAFAAAQRALADFQLGETERCVRDLRALLRRFAEFDDARAALAAALWSQGLEAQAEGEWSRVGDARYKDMAWVRRERSWPPKLADALASFLRIETVVR